MHLEDGSRPEVVALPMPAPLYFGGGRLQASNANFYISNAAVIVPTFNDPNDRVALGSLGKCPSSSTSSLHMLLQHVDNFWRLRQAFESGSEVVAVVKECASSAGGKSGHGAIGNQHRTAIVVRLLLHA